MRRKSSKNQFIFCAERNKIDENHKLKREEMLFLLCFPGNKMYYNAKIHNIYIYIRLRKNDRVND